MCLKKVKIISLLCVLIIISILVVSLSKSSSNKLNKELTSDVLYAISLDGEPTDVVPSKGNYEVYVTCENGEGSWDYDNWELKVNKMTGNNVFCSISFNTTSKTNLNEYITSLEGTVQGDGE